MRRGALIVLLACGCAWSYACSSKSSSSSDPAPAAGGDDAQAAPEPARDDARERACRGNGDGDTCMTAAAHASKLRHSDVAKELFALACARGNGAGCAAYAETSRTPSLWHGRACRRGVADSCALADPWAAALRGRATATGDAPAWLADEYARAVEDCAAELPRAARDSPGRASFHLTPEGADITAAEPAALRPCLATTATRTRRPSSAAVTIDVEWGTGSGGLDP